MKKHPLNVLKYGYEKPHSLRSIKENIKNFFRSFKRIYQRLVWGFCEYDTFNLDYYYSTLLAESLMYFAETTMSHPVSKTMEEWKNYLTTMAQHFYNSIEENSDTPYYQEEDRCWEAYHNAIDSNFIKTDKGFVTLNNTPKDGYTEEEIEELINQWMDAMANRFAFNKEELHKGLSDLENSFYDLWS